MRYFDIPKTVTRFVNTMTICQCLSATNNYIVNYNEFYYL